MASAPTANEIKTQLKTLLAPVIGTTGTRKVLIFDYMALAFKPAEGEDPTILRSTLDPVTIASGEVVNRINCLMITEEGFTQGSQPDDATRGDSHARPSHTITRRFRLTYFYQFGGTSENTFSATVELIRKTIEQSPRLGFALVAGTLAGQGAYIEGHDEVQAPVMIPDAFGDVICHVAEMTLAVRLTKTAIR